MIGMMKKGITGENNAVLEKACIFPQAPEADF